jgi:hypothetical protein
MTIQTARGRRRCPRASGKLRKAASGSVPVRKAKVAKSKPAKGILLSLIPRDGSITAMQTASIMFSESRVRDMVAFESLPDVIASEQEPVLEMRAERALVAHIGEGRRALFTN